MEIARQDLQVHAGDDVADRLGAHAGPEDASAAGTGAVLLVQIPELGLEQELLRLEPLDLVTLLADVVAQALRLLVEPVLFRSQRFIDGCLEVGDLLLGGAGLVGLALLELLVHALRLGADDLLQAAGGLAAALVAGRHDHLAGRLEGDRLLGRLRAQLGQARLDLLRGGNDLLGPRGALALQVGAGRREGRVQLVLLAVDVGAELILHLGERLARRPTATLGLFLELEQRPLARLLIDMGVDVQREVEDALQVAWADVEQDAQARGRALEVPDVADRAGKLDVAHPLAADLRAGDLDAALVADDALVANPLVLAAVALPVLGGTEDALVEEAVLLRLERAVVDRLGLGYLALGPLPDLVRAGERDTDGREVIDLEHGSPPRRRLARRRDAERWRAAPYRPEPGATLGFSRVVAGAAKTRAVRRSPQSSNPARLIPPRSGSRKPAA